ncbi:MAG TPA: cytochrome c oxidase subunit II [Gemmataceae bacterium]|nr:cytochrome c oxidase subunit II [Gemmataceae bacterium]
MLAEIIFWPAQASTTAHWVDVFFFVLASITGSVGFLVAVLLIYFSVRYRRRPGDPVPGPMPGNTLLELFWTLTPLAIFMVIYTWGVTLYFGAYRPPDDATVVYGIGKQWMWKFQHPEGQREINELHVPVGRPIQVRLTSEDVIHSFFVPDFRVHMDVLPERYTSVWFQATQPGDYHLFCSQYCGTNHAGMIGWVHVLTPGDYQTWLDQHAEGSLALQGRKTFLKYRCISCHSGEHGRAPVLEDLYGSTVHLRDRPPVVADDAYIRESVLDPGAKIVLGWENIMPTFRGQVSTEEINELIAYIKSLHRGETPRRVEEYPPPTTTPPINTK